MPNQTTDRWSFLVNFIKHPLRNASVAPSSRIAARNMLCGLDLEHLEYVVELGPGTGSFTRELYHRLPAQCKVLIVELEAGYVGRLRDQYGDRFDIVQASAAELDALLVQRNWPRVDLIISGLPFVLPDPVKAPLWNTLKRHTERGTVYRWFTYMPPLMKQHYKGFEMNLVRRVWANLPPMWIYSVN